MNTILLTKTIKNAYSACFFGVLLCKLFVQFFGLILLGRSESKRLENRIDKAYSGIASAAALASIPAPLPGKNVSFGLGFGNFESQSAIAFGTKALVGKNKDISVMAGMGYCDNTTTVSAGIGWSF